MTSSLYLILSNRWLIYSALAVTVVFIIIDMKHVSGFVLFGYFGLVGGLALLKDREHVQDFTNRLREAKKKNTVNLTGTSWIYKSNKESATIYFMENNIVKIEMPDPKENLSGVFKIEGKSISLEAVEGSPLFPILNDLKRSSVIIDEYDYSSLFLSLSGHDQIKLIAKE